MARTWLSVTVELLGGRGEHLWPWPGRVFAVGPSHTFRDLADAINDAFARWDLAHVSMFTLADGRVVVDQGMREEMAGSIHGPVIEPLDIETSTAAKVLEPGAEFQFTFDLGDGWTHRCLVEGELIDPVDVLGVRPGKPMACWGWGAIPDQYGRRWADDDGGGRAPSRPTQPHPMLLGQWPAREAVPDVDLSELRAAMATDDADRFLAASLGHDIDSVLQQVGAGVLMALQQRRERVEPLALSVVNRLSLRGCSGDSVLAEDIIAVLRDGPSPGRLVPVDLDMLMYELEGDPNLSTGGYLDLHTGDVIDEGSTDPAMVGEDAVTDVEAEPDRWLWIERIGSHDGWQDMADFARHQHDPALRDRMERAIAGKGAFRRFRDVLHEEHLVDQWNAFADDRRLGRARAFLADHGIRVGQDPPTRT